MENIEEKYDDVELESIVKLSKKLKEASKRLSKRDARYLVDMYYQMQRYRVSLNNQIRIAKKENEPLNDFTAWASTVTESLEQTIKKALDIYSTESDVGKWMRSIHGIGPVIASGIIAHIDMRHCEKDKEGRPTGKRITPGMIWRYAGLDPTKEWEKNTKRPWNAQLKTLCWKLGESFVKTQNSPKSFYGPIYKERRKYDEEKNERHGYEALAKKQLETKMFKKDTITKQAYMKGELTDGHIFSISKRVTVKLFLSHLWEVWYEIEYKEKPPRPWIFALGGHDTAHYIAPPNWPMK
jgi:hypothetical protein